MGPRQLGVKGKYSSLSLVPYANEILPNVDEVGLQLARERVYTHALRVPTILYIPGVQDVVKREEKMSPRNRAGHAKFLNFDLCRFRKLVKAQETKTERALNPSYVQTQEKGPPYSLRSSRPSYEVDFPVCNVQNIPHLLSFLLMTTHVPPPFQYPTSTGRPPRLPALPLPALSSLLQTQQHMSEILSLWQGRSQYPGSYLFMCWFIPSQ